MKAIWNDQVIARSDDTVVVEGNHYFPREGLREEFLVPTETKTTCGWKGEASYYTVRVEGEENRDAAWYYPDPRPEAAAIADRVAFWHGVVVEEE